MDSDKINTNFNPTSLEERYLKQWAGGAFNVHDSLKTEGTNTTSIGPSYHDKQYTVNSGFKINQQFGVTEFKDAANGGNSLQQSIYMDGFNNTPYK